jgi:hypothetical protein
MSVTMIHEVDVVLKQVEGLLRNANSKAISDTARISARLLNWFSSLDAADEVYKTKVVSSGNSGEVALVHPTGCLSSRAKRLEDSGILVVRGGSQM